MVRQWATLGDQALLAYFANEADALGFANVLRDANFEWLDDVVQAYKSVAVFFALDRISPAEAQSVLATLSESGAPAPASTGKRHQIPCCYEMALDWQRIIEHTGLDRDETIRLHAATMYTVYAIGFCPGFPYLGYLPGPLCGVPRLDSPRVRLEAGSVGLTGRQTGIYTMPRPGGWNIVGCTPLQLVDVSDAYFPLQVGDCVQFMRIDETSFRELLGERL